MKTYNKGFEIKNYNRQLYGQKRSLPFGIMMKIWFGNPLTFMGLMFIGMGIPFTMIFAPISTFFGPSFDENDPVAKGIIVEASGTSSYINEVQVYSYNYKFETPNGEEYLSTGYATGNVFSIDNEVVVSYKRDEPKVSKADGLRTSTFGSGFTIFVWIFPIVGFIMFILSLRKVIRQLQVLRVGEISEGKFLYEEATNTKINKQTVYALTFEFTAKDGKTYQAVAKTHHTSRLKDEEFEKLVYDPVNPSNAVLLDALPRGIKNYFLHHYGK